MEPTEGIRATGEKCVKVLTKIVWLFVRHPCFFYSSANPEDPCCKLFGITFLFLSLLSLSLPPLLHSPLLFISKSIFEVSLSAIFHCRHRNFNAVDSLLPFSFSLAPPLPWSGQTSRKLQFQQNTNAFKWCNNHPAKPKSAV